MRASEDSKPDVSPRLEAAQRIQRLRRIRQALLEAPYHLCTQKAELLTDFLQSEGDDDPLTRIVSPLHFAVMKQALARNLGSGAQTSEAALRVSNALQSFYLGREERTQHEALIVQLAHGFAHVLANKSIELYEDELILGNPSAHRIGSAIHPDYGGLLMLPELHELGQREVNPMVAEPEQVRRLEEDILPFWFPRSIMSRTPLLTEDGMLQNRLVSARDFVLTQFAGISHITPNYPLVLEIGFRGLLARVEEQAKHAQTEDQKNFYASVRVIAEAAIDYAKRCAAYLAQLAKDENDPQRKAEIAELAQIVSRVPEGPAQTFHEALQSVFLTHVMVHQESFQHGVSFGRVDQYLWPYLQADLESGRIDEARAIELMGCFLAKAAEQLPLFNMMATEFFSGLSSASGLTLGGTTSTGEDASNPLTRIVLLAYDQLRLRQPNLHLRIHEGSPQELRLLAAEVVKRGGGMPAFFRDEGVVDSIRGLGVPLEAARDYSIVGCVEWGVPYRSFPAAGAGFVSLPAALDDVLHREGAQYNSAEDVWVAFRDLLRERLASIVQDNNAIEQAHALYRPTPFLSLLTEGCLEDGRDCNAGGALYDSTGLQGVGVADVADSFAAMQQEVFSEVGVGFETLLEALDADFEGHEALRLRLLNHAPKFGQDTGMPERWARRVAELFAALVREHVNPRGGPYAPGFWSMTTHVGFGRRLGALPSGRSAGRPLSNGFSPASGADNRGPTASMMSIARATGSFVGNGLALNETLDPTLTRGEAGSRVIDGLVRGYFSAGGNQVQFNVLDVDELIDAKAHPERHRGLVVRISGYSAYFNDLTEAMKDELIARSRHGAPMVDPPACQVETANGEPA